MRTQLIRLTLGVIVAGGLLAACGGSASSIPTIKDAWVRAPMGAGAPGAAYMTIVGGSSDDALIGVSSPISPDVQMHETVMKDNQMAMQQVQQFAIPANSTFELKSGGNHIMLMGITQELKEGDTVELRLTFESAGEIVVQAPVKAGS